MSTRPQEDELCSFKKSMRGVKCLVDNGLDQIPKFYVRSQPLEDPVECNCLPVIDMGRLHGPDRHLVIGEIGKACEEWGFFQVVNHGVPATLTEQVLDVVDEFFSVPIQERMPYFSTDLWNRTRFGTSHNPALESVLEWKDYLRHPCLPLEQSMLSWPIKPASYRPVASEYCQRVKLLAEDLLKAISEALGLGANYLDRAFGDAKLLEMFSNYYPPCPNPELTIGLGEHSDAGGITVLLQNEVCGLEVRRKGQWYGVRPVKGALIVNIGDQIQMLSNGRFKSVEHRARVNSSRTRISVATFYQPSLDAVIGPASELSKDGALYKSIKFMDYVKGFFNIKLEGKTYLDTAKIDLTL